MFCGHSKMYAGAWLHRNTQSRDATTKHHQSSGRSGGSERGKTCTSSAFLPVVARPLSLRSFCSSSTLSLFNSAAGILEYSPDPVTCRARRFWFIFFFQFQVDISVQDTGKSRKLVLTDVFCRSSPVRTGLARIYVASIEILCYLCISRPVHNRREFYFWKTLWYSHSLHCCLCNSIHTDKNWSWWFPIF